MGKDGEGPPPPLIKKQFKIIKISIKQHILDRTNQRYYSETTPIVPEYTVL